MNLSRLKLGTLLFTGFGIVILFILIFEIFSSIQMKKLATLTEDMYNHPLIVSNTIRDIEINIYAMHRIMKDAVLVDEYDNFENSMLTIDSLEKNTLQKFEIVKKQFLGNPDDVEIAYKSFINWKSIRNEIAISMKRGDIKKAVDITKGEAKEQVTSLISKINKVIVFANTKANTFYETSKKVYNSEIKIVLVFSLLLIILASVSAYLITKSITNPINKIIKNIIRISKQNFDTDIDSKESHHIVLLENLVNKLEELSSKLAREYNNKQIIQKELKESQDAMIFLLEDVNEIKDELEKTVIKLQSSNAELESFVYSISHDLRAPLRSIMGFSEIISQRYKKNLNDEGLEYFGYILEAGKNMANLIEDLLKFSRLVKGSVIKGDINLNEILEYALKILNQDIKERKAKINIPNNMPVVKGDSALLSQIFTNLIQNAIVYHRKGIIPEITLLAEEDENNFIIKIKDNGQGIPREHHEKIFNIFQRLHANDEFPGTGIGLAIVKKAVEALGGSISLESEVGKGSTFSVHLSKN